MDWVVALKSQKSGKSMIDVASQRWREAQIAESSYWRQAGVDTLELLRITREKVGAVRWAQRAVKPIFTTEGSWVEVGIGPLGVGCIHFLPKSASANRELIGLDPLPRTEIDIDLLPVSLAALIEACHSDNYQHLVGIGEDIALPSDSAALVACYNVLNHCLNPENVVEEISRILKHGGHLILGCDVYSLAGLIKCKTRAMAARMLGIRLNSIGDVAHPHHFLATDLESLVLGAGLEILATNIRRFEHVQRIWSHSHRMLIVARKLGSAG